MKFKVKKIRPKHKNWREKLFYNLSQMFGKNGARLFIAFFPVVAIFFIALQIVNLGFLGDGTSGISRISKSLSVLEKDDHGHINILLLGVAGASKEGGNLSDSIMVASLNPKENSASFLSLPRDLHIDSEVGGRKINEIYAAGKYKHRKNSDEGKSEGLRITKEAVSAFVGVNLQYAAVIDFDLFEDTIDALGGIDIFVPEDIVDVEYPAENWKYETFIVRAGKQNFDGETALKYARSRHSTSDYDRARRQQDIIFAIKEKALNAGILASPTKMTNLYNVFIKNMNTDIGITEMLALAKIGIGIEYSGSLKMVLNDDPTTAGGFLFAPAREFFGGQFVLRPDNIKETQAFMELVLISPEILLEKAQVSVQNGSKISGLASVTAQKLKRFGFNIIEVGNYDTDIPVFRHKVQNLKGKDEKHVADFITDLVGGITEEKESVEDVLTIDDLIDIRIILGTN